MERSPDSLRSHMLDVSSRIAQQQLFISFAYSENLHKAETIEALAQKVHETLVDIINLLPSATARQGVSHEVNLDGDDYDNIISELDIDEL